MKKGQNLNALMDSFEKLLKAKIPLRLKSFHVKFDHRTLLNCSKLFKSGLARSSLWGWCTETACTKHVLYCHFPKLWMLKIAAFLNEKFHQGVPHIHLCRMKWYLYNKNGLKREINQKNWEKKIWFISDPWQKKTLKN